MKTLIQAIDKISIAITRLQVWSHCDIGELAFDILVCYYKKVWLFLVATQMIQKGELRPKIQKVQTNSKALEALQNGLHVVGEEFRLFFSKFPCYITYLLPLMKGRACFDKLDLLSNKTGKVVSPKRDTSLSQTTIFSLKKHYTQLVNNWPMTMYFEALQIFNFKAPFGHCK